MRDDMFKVIVERPRLVNSNGYSGDGRPFRNREEVPHVLGMKRGYGSTKWLNENLAPLRRYLASQVNRPWDKVYSEIRAAIDARSTVKQHVLQHIADFVAIDTYWLETPEGGKVMVRGRWTKQAQLLENSRCALFVHPRTGILLANRRYVSHGARVRKARAKQHEAQAANRRVLGPDEQLQLHDGIWYHVALGTLPAARAGTMGQAFVYDACWDVLRREWVTREPQRRHWHESQPIGEQLYGDATRYAVAKRQLSSKELRKHGLCS
jgi:hypothetical protein